jgi:diacylglycerol kinase family enzyme
MIDRDAQQATGRPVDFDQVVAQSGDGLLNDVL